MNFSVDERKELLEDLIGPGVLVAVAGPSGAGKDSVINYARAHLGSLAQEVTFVRRSITRAADQDAEDYESLTEDNFARRLNQGDFAAYWHANGLIYGLPVSMDRPLSAGGVVVANVSRSVFPELRQRYAHVLPVIVTAPAEVLAGRLIARARESREEVVSRLERANAGDLKVENAVVIANDRELEIAGRAFLAVLHKAVAWGDVGEII